MRRVHAGWVVLLAGGVAVAAHATEIGDKAPALSVQQWVKGEPVTVGDAASKHVVVLEFWATWCAPCRATIPHLTELQQRFKDKGVVIVGISAEENALEKVPPFVQKWGDRMAYTVAVDQNGLTRKAYYDEFMAQGIPWAFIVDTQGRIVWTGSPQDELEPALEQVLAGSFDLEKSKKSDAERKSRARVERESRRLLQEYKAQSTTTRGGEELRQLGEAAYKSLDAQPEWLNELAWFVLTNPKVLERDLPLAMKAAERANELTKGENPAILDTYARALFDTGRVPEAIATQEKAVSKCRDDQMRPDLEEALRKYKAAAK